MVDLGAVAITGILAAIRVMGVKKEIWFIEAIRFLEALGAVGSIGAMGARPVEP